MGKEAKSTVVTHGTIRVNHCLSEKTNVFLNKNYFNCRRCVEWREGGVDMVVMVECA